MSRDLDRLRDIVEYLDKIEEHRPDGVDGLRSDEVLAAAIVRWIEIVGEAAANVSGEMRTEHPEVSAGLRVSFDDAPGAPQEALIALRGGYSGTLMFGMIGGILGVAALGPVSIGAGLALGGKAVRQERTRLRTARQHQTRQAIRRHVDDAVLDVGKRLRDALRATHRELRDRCAARVAELEATASASLRAAERAQRVEADQRDARRSELDRSIDQLDRIVLAAMSATSSP